MKKDVYKVVLNKDNMFQVTYTVIAYSSKCAIYESKVKAFAELGYLRFYSVYVEKAKDGVRK